MSSSQDSDIQIQYVRMAKPKKLQTKFISSIAIQEVSASNSDLKVRFKKTRTDSNMEDKTITSNPSNNKFARRMPVALAILQTYCPNSKNVKFYAEDSVHGSDNFTTQTCLLSSISKRKLGQNTNALYDEQKWNQNHENFNQSKENHSNMTNMLTHDGKDRNDPKSIMNQMKKNINLKQKTAPIYSMNRGRTQIIKQFHRQGNKIRTHWQKGLINGYTQIDYFDGGKFRGIFKEGDIISGQMTFPNGFIYTGQFSMFAFHGTGKLKFPSGQVFQGSWIFGSLNGNGKISYPKGQIYYGQINNFKRDGHGYLYFQNGQKYVGQFYEGQISGFGQLHRQGKLINKGYWVKGKYVGVDQQIFKLTMQQAESIKSRKQKSQKSQAEKLIQSLKYLKQQQRNRIVQFKQMTGQLSINQEPVSICFDQKYHEFKSTPNLRIKKQMSLSLKMI